MTVDRDPIIAAVAAATLFLGACHATPSTPAEPTTPAAPVTDACALLNASEIGTVIGVPVDTGKHVLPNSAIMCSPWRPA